MAKSSGQTDVDELFNNLKISVQNKSDVIDILRKLSEKLNHEVPDKLQMTTDVLDQLAILLQQEKSEVSEKVAEIIANLVKEETRRELFTHPKVVSRLCQLLNTVQVSKDALNYSIAKQICRALGNLCYENDKCRKIVVESNGLKTIIDVIKQAVGLGKTEKGSELRSCSVGLLLNLVAGFDDFDPSILKSEAVNLICDVLECGIGSKEDEAATIHCMIILGVIADADSSPVLNERLCKILVELLKASSSGELVEFCVELLHSQAEHATVSLCLAKAGLCELLIQLLEKHKNLAVDVDTKNLFKMACDLIIIVLNEDESMKLLFDNGKGDVFTSVVNWLSSNVEELKVTGVLAIGNFARADSNCIEMVKQGISKKLLAILAKNNTDAGDIKLQHALLCALRNLVIPDQNKAIVIGDGLLDTLYPMVSVSSYPVVFKFIGTLRIVMDKQSKVAQELCRHKDLTRRMVEWCGTDHAGIQGEACRFLAWLTKLCKDEDVCIAMIENNAVPKIVDMIVSDYEVMQNEALIALTFMSALMLTRVEKIFVDCKIGEKLTRLINEKKPQKEVFENVLTLVQTFAHSEILKNHLRQNKVSKALTEFQKTQDPENKRAAEVTKLLESG